MTLVVAEAMDVVGILVRDAPDPLKSIALTVPITSSGVVGVWVPIPMLLPIMKTLLPVIEVVN